VKIDNEIIGYGSLLYISGYPDFKNSGIPEINDVWISGNYRRNGFGKRLIHHLERIAKNKHHKQIGIGVGLYKDYGSAQKLYVRMGYIPDGNGVTYKYQSVVPGDPYPLDDELIIWLKKDL
jgi:GNAT superfamily N-acetyltransferase